MNEDQYHEDQEAAEYMLAVYDGSVEAIIVWGGNDMREDETK